MWELLVLLAVIAAVHWWEYSTSVQEYTFAQPADHDDLGRVLQEKTPIALEIGSLPWRPEVAGKAMWTVDSVPIQQWLADRAPIGDKAGLAEQMGLTTGLTDLDVGRPWWWLPELRDAQVDILQGIVGLSWVSAERHWIGCSHGAPLTLWLTHSRYRKFLPGPGSGSGSVNPWALTVAEAPWIGRVQYIEVTVKPGWCIGLPAHWGFAIRTLSTENSESWIWSAEQHSMFSFTLNLPVHKILNMLDS